jgi:hypothetical protein
MNSSFWDWQVIGLAFLRHLQVEVLYSESCNNIILFWLGKLCRRNQKWKFICCLLNLILEMCYYNSAVEYSAWLYAAWLWTMRSVDCSWTTYSSWCTKTHAKVCHYPIAYNPQHHSLYCLHIANWRLPTPLPFLLWHSQITQLWRYKILG